MFRIGDEDDDNGTPFTSRGSSQREVEVMSVNGHDFVCLVNVCIC